MKKTCYNLTAFNLNDALSGGLCMAVNSTFTPTGPVCDYMPATPEPESESEDAPPYIPRDYMQKNEDVLGTGICHYDSPYLLININNDTYVFDESGKGVTSSTKYYKLWMATVTNLDGNEVEEEKYEGTPDAGLDIDTYTDIYSRGNYLYITDAQTTKRLSNLTIRDKFANNALHGILGRINNPAALSISEIQFYCEAAYRWSDSMMLSAAYRRSRKSCYWKNDNIHDSHGDPVINYTDSWEDLRDAEMHSYTSEEAAVEDGWVFYPEINDDTPTLENTLKDKLDAIKEAISSTGTIPDNSITYNMLSPALQSVLNPLVERNKKQINVFKLGSTYFYKGSYVDGNNPGKILINPIFYVSAVNTNTNTATLKVCVNENSKYLCYNPSNGSEYDEAAIVSNWSILDIPYSTVFNSILQPTRELYGQNLASDGQNTVSIDAQMHVYYLDSDIQGFF